MNNSFNNKYRLIACDIDGTLINSKKELTQKTLDSIYKALDNNVIFAISTGRPLVGTKIISNLIDRDIPLIIYNGSMVITSRSLNKILELNLSNQDAKDVIEIINKNNGTYCFWANEKVYVNRLDKYTNDYINISKIAPIIIDNNTEIKDVVKIIWFDENVNLKRYQKEELSEINGINYFTSQLTFLEIVNKEASKANALKKLGEYYNIERVQMIAVGDGFNDLPMLEYAGLGVAMSNSEEDVKKQADYITLSNNEDGVSKVIDKFIFGE